MNRFFSLTNATVAEGKLYVHGGGISRVNAPSLPIAMNLTIVCRLIIEDEDIGASKRLSITVADPDGSMMLPP